MVVRGNGRVGAIPFEGYRNSVTQKRLTDWRPHPVQIRIAMDRKYPLVDREDCLILMNRPALWENGTIDDIRIGDFIVEGSAIRNDQGSSFDTECYDWAYLYMQKAETMWELWSRGLQKNISMKIGDKNILVMDKHNYAAAFIIDMHNKGIVSSGSSMVHLDFHADYHTNVGFDIEKFNSCSSDKERLGYLLSRTGISHWQRDPLINTGIVDINKWHWVAMDDNGVDFGVFDPLSRDQIASDGIELEEHNFDMEGNAPDIMDVDLDFLLPLDEDLSSEQKRAIAEGHIPRAIKEKLLEVAFMARKAKVVTIALSPGFIVQWRAVEYAKELIRCLQRIG